MSIQGVGVDVLACFDREEDSGVRLVDTSPAPRPDGCESEVEQYERELTSVDLRAYGVLSADLSLEGFPIDLVAVGEEE